MSSEVVFDIETNGLTPDKIWCVADSTGFFSTEEYSFNDEDMYYGHNSIGFDLPVLANIWGLCGGRSNQRDTLVLSRLANPSRAGGHSLDAWGRLLGFPKGEHSDWDRYSPEMQRYCERDVQLTVSVLAEVKKELVGFSERSIELEHQVAWIVQEQVNNGWLLNQEAVFMLLAELKEKKIELEDTVRTTFTPRCKGGKEVTPRINKDGTLSAVGLKYYGRDWHRDIGGVHTRVDFPEFNLGSRKQIGEYLIALGWTPAKYTDKGAPIVSEVVLKDVEGIPECTLIADYLTVVKRIAMAQSWLDKVDADSRVRGQVNSCGAVTGRMTHYSPNMGQVTAGSKIYGSEMRDCWVVADGYKLVGMDASGLELRMLAHYMNNAVYSQEILNGDIHAANQRAAGLSDRNTAKTFIYAFLYGAGDAKIGNIVGGGAKSGRELKRKFLANTPALAQLRDRVSAAAKRGWLRGLDGRRIAVRSPHAALNTLLQGAGAVVMKQALVNLHKFATSQKLDFKIVGNIHDEIQTEVSGKDAERFGKLAVYAMTKAGEDFNLTIPLAGEYKIGNSWKETH
jgi:DNA polymerase-1